MDHDTLLRLLVAGPRDQRRARRDQAHRDAATLRDLTREDDDA